jgi:hypothetical protein
VVTGHDPLGRAAGVQRRLLESSASASEAAVEATPRSLEASRAVLPGLRVRLGSPLALPLALPVLPEKHFEQIADSSLLCLLRKGMTQR